MREFILHGNVVAHAKFRRDSVRDRTLARRATVSVENRCRRNCAPAWSVLNIEPDQET
jgi:hypothetical protein